MKIILSPAKKMIVDTDNLVPVELPVYIDKTAEVLNWMKSKSKEELKAIWKCNDKIAEQNFNRLENMNLYNRLRSDLSSDSEYVFERKINLLERIHNTHGIEFVDYDISFKGICPKCREKVKEEQHG